MPDSQSAHFGQTSNVNWVLSTWTYLNRKQICVKEMFSGTAGTPCISQYLAAVAYLPSKHVSWFKTCLPIPADHILGQKHLCFKRKFQFVCSACLQGTLVFCTFQDWKFGIAFLTNPCNSNFREFLTSARWEHPSELIEIQMEGRLDFNWEHDPRKISKIIQTLADSCASLHSRDI